MSANSYHAARTAAPPAPSGCPVDHAWDPLSEEYLRDPYAIASALRDEQPIFYAESLGYVVVTRMADIEAVFRDPDTFASANVQDPVFPLEPGGRRSAGRPGLRPGRGDVEPGRARPRPHPGLHAAGLL